jgi:hypothetical protein
MTPPCPPFQHPLTATGSRNGVAGLTRLHYRQHYRPARFRLPDWLHRVWLWC